MAYKKKTKVQKSKPTKSQHIKQVVNVNISKPASKRKSSGGRKQLVNIPKTPSSGFILPQYPPQVNQFLQPQDRMLLVEDIKKQFPLLTYQPPQEQPKLITDGGYKAQIIQEPTMPTFSESSAGSENIEFQISDITPTVPISKEPKPIRIRAPPSESIPLDVGVTRRGAKPPSIKITDTKSKLSQYNFPERIANKGTTARESDIDAIVEMMYNSNTNQNANISAADLQRAYGISSGAVKKRLERITGLKSIRSSKIPTLKEYNLV